MTKTRVSENQKPYAPKRPDNKELGVYCHVFAEITIDRGEELVLWLNIFPRRHTNRVQRVRVNGGEKIEWHKNILSLFYTRGLDSRLIFKTAAK